MKLIRKGGRKKELKKVRKLNHVCARNARFFLAQNTKTVEKYNQIAIKYTKWLQTYLMAVN
jgi:hypothetical protein